MMAGFLCPDSLLVRFQLLIERPEASLPAVHLFELADARPFDRCGGRGAADGKGGGAGPSGPQLLRGDPPQSLRRLLLLLWFVRLFFGRARRHGLEEGREPG